MPNVFQNFDGLAEKVSKTMELFVYSMDGYLEKTMREHPNYSGLNRIHSFAEVVSKEILSSISWMPKEFGFAFSDDSSYQFFVDSVNRQLQEIKFFYVKRFRDILLSRAWKTNTGSQDPRVLTRNARSISVTNWAYLSARKAVIDTYNDNQIQQLLSSGHTKFKLRTPEGELEEIFDIQDYPSVKDTMLHPRSNLVVGEPYVYPE